MKKTILLIAAIAIFIGIGNIAFAQEAELNKKAPDFTLTDSNGDTHSLSDFAGKTIVLEWINYGCPFVVKHYDSDNMQNLQKKHTENGVVWLAICSSAEGKQGHMKPEEINKKSSEMKAGYTAYLIDESGEVGKMYGAKVTPHMYIIDSSGNLVYAGGIDDKASTDQSDIEGAVNYVDKALKELLNGRNVTTQTSKPYGCSVKYSK
jgi:peroxiredoxin